MNEETDQVDSPFHAESDRWEKIIFTFLKPRED